MGNWVNAKACSTTDYAVPPPQYTETVVNFDQPVSDKAPQSGAWQFVVGCSCTIP